MQSKDVSGCAGPGGARRLGGHCLFATKRRGFRVRAYLVLNEELDTLDGRGSGLGDSGRDTTHCSSSCQPCPNPCARGYGFCFSQLLSRSHWPSPQCEYTVCVSSRGVVIRTQEVDEERRHAHDGLLCVCSKKHPLAAVWRQLLAHTLDSLCTSPPIAGVLILAMCMCGCWGGWWCRSGVMERVERVVV